MPFNPPDLLKGFFRTTRTNRTITFQFNPTSFSRKHGYAYNDTSVGGRSHPLKSGGAGEDESYSFELWLDGDRVQRERQTNSQLERQQNNYYQSGLSIEGDLNDLRSLTRPFSYYVEGAAHGSPETVLCYFGTVVLGDECVVNSISENIVHFTKNLEPQRAVVTVELSVLQSFNQPAYDFHTNYPTRSFTTAEQGDVLKSVLSPFDITNAALSGF